MAGASQVTREGQATERPKFVRRRQDCYSARRSAGWLADMYRLLEYFMVAAFLVAGVAAFTVGAKAAFEKHYPLAVAMVAIMVGVYLGWKYVWDRDILAVFRKRCPNCRWLLKVHLDPNYGSDYGTCSQCGAEYRWQAPRMKLSQGRWVQVVPPRQRLMPR